MRSLLCRLHFFSSIFYVLPRAAHCFSVAFDSHSQPSRWGSSLRASTTGEDCTTSSNMQLKNGVADIVDMFDTFLLDMWGVMHDGSKPYEGVLEVVHELHEKGKKLVVLSNSSKRRDNSIKMLKKLGFNPDDFDMIITSGEVAYDLLSGQIRIWDTMDQLQNDPDSKNVIVFGSGDKDEEYCESSGWRLSPVEKANLIVARGTFTVNDGIATVHKRDDPELYEAALEMQLRQAAERRIPMLVSNPDKVRPDVGRPPMPGKIGDRYEEILRETLSIEEAKMLVKRIGKPFSDVYHLAINENESLDRICMVGDALETDIVGGSQSGIATIWCCLDGIHGPDLEGPGENLLENAHVVLEEFNKRGGTYAGGERVVPDIILRHFRW